MRLTEEEDQVASYMLVILRHEALREGIAVNEDGWSLMADVISVMQSKWGSWITERMVETAAQWSGYHQGKPRLAREAWGGRECIKATSKVRFRLPQQNASASSS